MKQQVTHAVTWLGNPGPMTQTQHGSISASRYPQPGPCALDATRTLYTSQLSPKGCVAGQLQQDQPSTAPAAGVPGATATAKLSRFLGHPAVSPMVTPACQSRSTSVIPYTSVSGQEFPHHVVEGHMRLSCVYIHARSTKALHAVADVLFHDGSSQHGRSCRHTLLLADGSMQET